MKKIICVILSVVLIFSTMVFNVSAVDEDVNIPFSCQIYPTKQSYEKGEEITICLKFNNTSLDEVTDMRIWLDYPLTEYYITPGVTERFFRTTDEEFDSVLRAVENKDVLKIASKFENTTVIKGFLLKFAHAYKSFTLAYTTLRYRFQNGFFSLNQKQCELGKTKVIYNGTEIEFTVNCRYSLKKSAVNEMTKLSSENGIASADIKAVKNSFTGLTFAIDEKNNSFCLFAINPDTKSAYVYNVENGKYILTATKNVDIKADNFYKMKAYYDDNRVICYLFNNPKDTDPYPVFDFYYKTNNSGYGVYCQDGGYKDFSVAPYVVPAFDKTYINPVYENAPDPYILKDNGVYYLYATTNPSNGFSVSSSTDLVNWKFIGLCADKGDIYGNDMFWAPEVYKYQGKYYMLYSTDEHVALAVSDAPTGPFLKTKDSYILDHKGIDGHLFFDDDGSIYFYLSYFGEDGEEIRGYKMKTDLSGIQEDTATTLTTCQKDEGGINEGPFMLKHNGMYFLTYSVNDYQSQNYSVKLATSDSPLGKFKSKGTILARSGSLVGTGHHAFTTSPDDKELIIAYHCHYSTTQIHNRKLCIDRCKFVKTDDGYTISVYGPTSTPQPCF